MSSALAAFHKMVVAAIKESPACAVLTGGRVYKPPPQDVAFPFVLIGDAFSADAGDDCAEDACECSMDVHVFSRAHGDEEAKTIMSALHSALHMPDPSPPIDASWTIVSLHVSVQRSFTDPDGITTHGVLTVEAFLDPA